MELKIFEILQKKGIQNLNLSNLLDIKAFLRNNQNSKISELNSEIENLL